MTINDVSLDHGVSERPITVGTRPGSPEADLFPTRDPGPTWSAHPVLDLTPTIREHTALVDAIQSANQDLKNCLVAEGRQQLERLAAEHPGQPGICFALGGACLEAGDCEAAIGWLERAVALRPAFALYWRHLGDIRMQAGRTAEGVEALERAIRLEPTDPASLLATAVANFQIGRVEAGRAYLGQALRKSGQPFRLRASRAFRTFDAMLPIVRGAFSRGYPTPLRLELGQTHLRHRDLEAAETCFRTVLKQRPDDPEASLGLGRTLVRKEFHIEALGVLRQAAERNPDDPRVLVELAIAHYHLQDFDGAHALLEEALRHSPHSLRANRFMGWTLLTLEQPERALAHFRKCLEADPASADARFGIFTCFRNRGEFQESRKALDDLLATDPAHAGAWLAMVTNDKSRRTPETLEHIENLLYRPGLTRQARIHSHFAAGLVADHLDDVRKAFGHYHTANALKDVTCDIEALSDLANRIIERFPARLLARNRNDVLASDRPIFIVGMPRSGSTLVEQILASHPDVTGGGELRLLPRIMRQLQIAAGENSLVAPDDETIGRVARQYLFGLDRIDSRAARVSDKMLFNFWHVGIIALALPGAHLIHTVRDPHDCCTSIYLRDFVGTHAYAYNQHNLGRYYRLHERLMAHWKTVLPGRILTVSYEDMIDNPAQNMRRIVEHCGLPWDERCATFHETRRIVSTSSYAQVRQPIYKGSIGRWKRYEPHLAELINALAR